MRLKPRYDGPAVLQIAGPIGDPSVPLLRQRRRLGELLSDLDDEQWAAPSRCDAWSVRDVVAHLIGTDQFWALSAASGLAGEPTRYLDGFDPAKTPAQMVDGMADQSNAEVLAGYLGGVDALAAVVTDLDDEQWSAVAEAPPGHVSLHALGLHALWDGWTHERDIVLPLGRTPVVEADEVIGCLRYSAGLGPAFSALRGANRAGTLVLEGTDPETCVVVEAGDPVVVSEGERPAGAVHLRARTVDLVEALSFRAPWPTEVAAEDRWLLGDLGAVFDAIPAP